MTPLRVLLRPPRRLVAAWCSHQRFQLGVLWPVLIDTAGSWENYYQGLSKPAKKNWKASQKTNSNLTYAAEPVSMALLARFMGIWDQVHKFPPNYMDRLRRLYERGWLAMYAARDSSGAVVALHVVEKYGHYGRCHATWYDAGALSGRGLSTFMWFSLLQHSMETPVFDFLDLGGGPLNRLQDDHYKRRYRPVEKNLIVRICASCEYMYLAPSTAPDPGCPSCGASRVHADFKQRLVLAISRVL